jgi:hypothetical protein
MRKNIIMLCSALSFAMAATDDVGAMMVNVSDISIGNAKVSTTGLIAGLKKVIKGKGALEMVTTSFPPEGMGDCPTVICPVKAIKRFISLVKKEKIRKEQQYGSFLFRSFLHSVKCDAVLSPSKISIPVTCILELQDMYEAMFIANTFFMEGMAKIEAEQSQDGWFDFFLSPILEE